VQLTLRAPPDTTALLLPNWLSKNCRLAPPLVLATAPPPASHPQLYH
jgi:hypothetical protein